MRAADIRVMALMPSRKDTTAALLVFKYGDPWQQLPFELRRIIMEYLWRYTFYCHCCCKTMVIPVPSDGLIFWLHDEHDTTRKICSIRCAAMYVAMQRGFFRPRDEDKWDAQAKVIYDFCRFQKALDWPLVGQIK